MIVAHLSKPWQSIPPIGYGGIERIIYDLVREQSNSCSVHLFAPATTKISSHVQVCSLFSECQADKGLNKNVELAQAVHYVLECIDLHVDILHAHSVDALIALTNFINIPSVFTFHSNPTNEVRVLSSLASTSIMYTFLSEYQRSQYPWINNCTTIYPGIDLDRFELVPEKGDYLVYVGRICKQKGVLDAIEIARCLNMPIKIAGKYRRKDKEYFKRVMAAIKGYKNSEFIGEVNDEIRNRLVGGAIGLLFPISAGEAFGLIQIEAMAVGTPVVTYNIGAAREIVVDNVTGYIVDNISEAIDAVARLGNLSPNTCRQHVKDNFSAKRMAQDFISLYEDLC